jgi:hypothetical protein
MALEAIRQQVRGWLLQLADCLWSEEHIARLARQADLLKDQVRHGYSELVQRRREIETLQDRIGAEGRKTVALPWEVQGYLQLGDRSAAWRTALELDQVRGTLESDRRRLKALQENYQRHVDRLERDRERLGQLQLRLLSLRPGVRPV